MESIELVVASVRDETPRVRSYLLHRAFRDLPDTSPFKHDGLEPGLMLANGVVAAGGRRG